MRWNLFETVQRHVGCNYLSDLQCSQYRPVIKACVKQYTAQDFPQREWADLHYYLLQTRATEMTAEAIQQELLNHL
ncbi:hypothetical protein RFF05_04395 [Bengtsoniella intestinalis]|uniref:hypothetical protein n=1 Tax=Bengtsoniella intestinalis TaxID=3073143 RepID=UPI00391EEAF2